MIGNPKKKRIVDEALCEEMRTHRCVNCPSTKQVTGHHVKSKKTGGHDIPENLCPLCFDCHRAWHDKKNEFVRDNPLIEEWLLRNNWWWDEFRGKWVNANAGA